MMNTSLAQSQRIFSIRGLGLIAAILVVIVSCFIPSSDTLSQEAIRSLGLLLAAIILWCCSTFALSITGILVLILAVLLNVIPVATAFSGFASTTFIYVIGIFALPAILMKTNWGLRLVSWIFKHTGQSSAKLVLAFMLATWLISTVMTDTPSIVVMMAPALVVVRAIGATTGKSPLAKAIYIGLPVASIIGGVATPAGSATNVAAMGFLSQMTGEMIPFLHWTAIGLPLTIALIPLFWFFIVKILKPEPIKQEVINALSDEVKAAGKPSLFEYKVLAMLILVPACWIVGNWIPLLSIVNVSILAVAIMMAPGVNLVTFDELKNTIPWNVLLMVGAVLSLGSMLAVTGGAAFLANLTLSFGLTNLGALGALIILSLFIYLFHTVCPIGPGAIGLFLPILLGICAEFGLSSIIPVMLLGFITAGNFLLPISPILAITFNEGHYSFTDIIKACFIPTVLSVVIACLWIVFASSWFGF